MTRTLDPALISTISEDATEPHVLLEIEFNDGNDTIYLSSYDDETVDSQLYKGGITKQRVRLNQGIFRAQFTINNADGAMSQALVFYGSRDHAIKYYMYYPGHSKVLVAQGIIDGAEWDRKQARINTRLSTGQAGRLPRLAMGPPMFNWFPEPGEQFVWGKTTFTKE